MAKGLPGRKTPTRITNDSYEQGVVKELQQMATECANFSRSAQDVIPDAKQAVVDAAEAWCTADINRADESPLEVALDNAVEALRQARAALNVLTTENK